MRSNTIQFLSNAGLVASAVFIPILAQEKGASDYEIGIIGTAYGIAIFISSYVFGRASDIYGRRIFLYAGLLLTGVTIPMHMIASTPLTLAMVRWVVGFCAGIFPATLVAHVYETTKKVAKFTAYGSLGWAVGYFIAGIIASYLEIFILSSVLLFASFFVALRMDVPRSNSSAKGIFTFDVGGFKKNIPVYLPFLIRHTGANAVWMIFPLYILSLGADKTILSIDFYGNNFSLGGKFWIGLISMINMFGQFFIMRSLDKYKTISLISTGLILSIITFTSFALVTDFRQLVPLQILLAAAWSCLYVGCVQFSMEGAEGMATSAGTLNSVASLSAVIGPFMGGLISEIYDYRATMYFAVIMSIAAYVVFRVFIRHVNKQETS